MCLLCFLAGALIFGGTSAEINHGLISTGIPFGCLYAFQESRDSYVTCRFPSMYQQMHDQKIPSCYDKSGAEFVKCRDAEVRLHIQWEIGALDALAREKMDSQKPER